MDPVVERAVDLDATAEDVWRALTEPEELASWFGPEADLDVRPGGRGRFVDDDGVIRRAVVDELETGERLVLRWWPEGDDPAGASVVTFRIAPTPGRPGVRLLVSERFRPTAGSGATAARSQHAAAAWAADAWRWRLDVLLLRVGVRCLV